MVTILFSSVEILIIIIIIIIIIIYIYIYNRSFWNSHNFPRQHNIKKKTFLKPGIIKKKKKKNTQKFQLKKIAKSLKLKNFLLPKTKTR